MSREEEIRAGLFDHTLNGHAPEVKALTEEGLKLGMDPMDILFKALIPSLEEVGRRFEKGDFFVPEMLIAARAMQGALAQAGVVAITDDGHCVQNHELMRRAVEYARSIGRTPVDPARARAILLSK